MNLKEGDRETGMLVVHLASLEKDYWVWMEDKIVCITQIYVNIDLTQLITTHKVFFIMW